MATSGQNYAVGIGTGAAAGAAAGTAILPGWGTAIGGVVGGIGGAISGAFRNSEEAKQKALLEAQQHLSRKAILINLLRNQAIKGGFDTTYLDTKMDEAGLDRQEASQNAAFAASQRIDPNSFVPIAQNIGSAIGGIRSAVNKPPDLAAKQEKLLDLQLGAAQPQQQPSAAPAAAPGAIQGIGPLQIGGGAGSAIGPQDFEDAEQDKFGRYAGYV